MKGNRITHFGTRLSPRSLQIRPLYQMLLKTPGFDLALPLASLPLDSLYYLNVGHIRI